MSGSLPPPLPGRRCCSSGGSMTSFIAGLILGGAAVAAVGYVHVQRERARAEEAALAAANFQHASRTVQDFLAGGPTQAGPAAEKPAATDADKVKALGDESVEDLRQGRLLAVYRLTTKEFQGGTKWEDFEKKVTEVSQLRFVSPNLTSREAKVRKAADGDGYEYYCSATGGFTGNVNVAIVFVPGDNGAWRIEDVRVGATSK
jgi:hypothetical protein